MPTTFFTRAEQDFWALRGSGWEQLHDYAERESGHTMRGKRARGHRGSPGPANSSQMGRWGRGAHPAEGEEGSRSQVGYKWLGRRKLWEGVAASREFWRDAGGRFLERGATLVPSSRSMSCTEPFLLVTLGCGSGRRMEGEPERAASRQKRLEAPGAQWWPAGVECAGRTGRRRGASARAHILQVTRPTIVPAS